MNRSRRKPSISYFTEEDRKLAQIMSDYWVNFAKHGHPNGVNLPAWLPYDKDNEFYLELDLKPVTKQHLLKKRLDGLEVLLQER